MEHHYAFTMIMLAWRAGLVDTLTFIQMSHNFLAQYSALVGASCVSENITARNMLAPVEGLLVAGQYITQSGISGSDRSKRVAMLAVHAALSGGSMALYQ